jgi:hypothetical protein
MNSQSFHTWENPTNHAYTHTHTRAHIIGQANPNGEEHGKNK